MRVMTVVGTRPEIIRLSRIIARLDETTEHMVVLTGQNPDPRLSRIFFEGLGLRAPDRELVVDVSSLGSVIAGVIERIEPVINEFRPDAFVVLGDTNSCLAAIIAKRLGVPVFHLEAGNRCFDERVPEEINRRIIDHLADFNLCYTEHGRRNLMAEGLSPRRTFVIGSPLREVLDHYAPRIAESSVLDDLALTRGGFVLASVHREENVDDPRNLTRIIASLLALRDRFGVRMVVSAHPRLRDRLERHRDAVGDISGIEFYEPFGYFDYMALQTNALCVVSDSGTISEESAMLGFPAVTIRESMERPEALDTGSIAITGLDPSTVTELVDGVLRSRAAGHRPMVPEGYDISDCSLRVCNLITGLAGLHRQWAGLGEPRSNDGDTIGG